MERSVAIKRLGKLLGKKISWCVDDKAPTREERAAAKAELPTAVDELKQLKARREERHKAILAADAECQALHAAYEIASERVGKLASITRQYKITVGTSDGPFFFAEAEGDSWEEIIDKVTRTGARWSA